MAEFSTVKTPYRFSGQKNTVVEAIVGEIDVVGRGDIGVKKDLNISAKGHYV